MDYRKRESLLKSAMWTVEKPPLSKLEALECYDVLYGLASTFNVQSYLEVGVREGASLCCVLAKEREIARFALNILSDGKNHLTCEIIKHIAKNYTLRRQVKVSIFDNWSYDGCEHGRSRVESLLRGGFGLENFTFYDGDSHRTLPQFKGKVDLAFIDGDHSIKGASEDLENVLAHAKIIVFHDLYHPDWGKLDSVFTDFCRRNELPYLIVGRKVLGTGIAFNIW